MIIDLLTLQITCQCSMWMKSFQFAVAFAVQASVSSHSNRINYSSIIIHLPQSAYASLYTRSRVHLHLVPNPIVCSLHLELPLISHLLKPSLFLLF